MTSSWSSIFGAPLLLMVNICAKFEVNWIWKTAKSGSQKETCVILWENFGKRKKKGKENLNKNNNCFGIEAETAKKRRMQTTNNKLIFLVWIPVPRLRLIYLNAERYRADYRYRKPISVNCLERHNNKFGCLRWWRMPHASVLVPVPEQSAPFKATAFALFGCLRGQRVPRASVLGPVPEQSIVCVTS